MEVSTASVFKLDISIEIRLKAVFLKKRLSTVQYLPSQFTDLLSNIGRLVIDSFVNDISIEVQVLVGPCRCAECRLYRIPVLPLPLECTTDYFIRLPNSSVNEQEPVEHRKPPSLSLSVSFLSLSLSLSLSFSVVVPHHLLSLSHTDQFALLSSFDLQQIVGD